MRAKKAGVWFLAASFLLLTIGEGESQARGRRKRRSQCVVKCVTPTCAPAASPTSYAGTTTFASGCLCLLLEVSHNPVTGYCQYYAARCTGGFPQFGPFDDYHGATFGSGCPSCYLPNGQMKASCRPYSTLWSKNIFAAETEKEIDNFGKESTRQVLLDEPSAEVVSIRFVRFNNLKGDETFAKLYHIRFTPPAKVAEEYTPVDFRFGWQIEKPMYETFSERIQGKDVEIRVREITENPDDYTYQSATLDKDDKINAFAGVVRIGANEDDKYIVRTKLPLE